MTPDAHDAASGADEFHDPASGMSTKSFRTCRSRDIAARNTTTVKPNRVNTLAAMTDAWSAERAAGLERGSGLDQ